MYKKIIFVTGEIINPRTEKKEYFILIDNGTGIQELYPKSLIECEKLEE